MRTGLASAILILGVFTGCSTPAGGVDSGGDGMQSDDAGDSDGDEGGDGAEAGDDGDDGGDDGDGDGDGDGGGGGWGVDELEPVASSPVVGVDGSGEIHYGFIDPDSGTPIVVAPDGERVELGNGRPASSMTMAVEPGGAVHVAWNEEGAIHYKVLFAGGAPAEHTLVEEFGRAPTLALQPTDGFVLAWTRDHGLPDEASYIEVVRGGKNGVGEVVIANKGCCFEDFGEPSPASSVSGPSIAVGADGRVHMVFEWSGISEVEIDYVVEDDLGFSEPLAISSAAFLPCPAIAVDDQGADILYVTPGYDRNLAYARVEDRTVVQDLIYDSGLAPDMGLMTSGPDGMLHLVYWAWDSSEESSRTVLNYVPFQGGSFGEAVELMDAPDPNTFVLTPGGGGIGVDESGGLLLPFVVRDSYVGAEAYLAWGRP